MTWDYEQCADYVKRSAPAGSRPLLLMPAARAYSSKFPNISIILGVTQLPVVR